MQPLEFKIPESWAAYKPQQVPYPHDYLTKVRLHGELAEAAGNPEYNLMVGSLQELMTALHHLTQQRTTKYIVEHNEHIRWRIIIDGIALDATDQIEAGLKVMSPREEMREVDVFPVIEGAGWGWLEALLGVVLIIASVFLGPGVGALGIGGLGLAWAGTVALLGVSLLLGGLSQLLFGPGNPAKTSSGEKANNLPSYLFSGQTNTMRQGGPVPLLYGKMIVGSQLASAALTNASFATGGAQGLSVPPLRSLRASDPWHDSMDAFVASCVPYIEPSRYDFAA
jgi:predicted phage tail protein